MPGLRAVQKYAVRLGGGSNHRFGLDDAILIKDNHVAIAGGVREALARARAYAGHLVKIELEVDTLDQLARGAANRRRRRAARQHVARDAAPRRCAWSTGARSARPRAASRPTTAPAIAASGVDLMSVGWLTHSATVLDIGLDLDV